MWIAKKNVKCFAILMTLIAVGCGKDASVSKNSTELKVGAKQLEVVSHDCSVTNNIVNLANGTYEKHCWAKAAESPKAHVCTIRLYDGRVAVGILESKDEEMASNVLLNARPIREITECLDATRGKKINSMKDLLKTSKNSTFKVAYTVNFRSEVGNARQVFNHYPLFTAQIFNFESDNIFSNHGPFSYDGVYDEEIGLINHSDGKLVYRVLCDQAPSCDD